MAASDPTPAASARQGGSSTYTFANPISALETSVHLREKKGRTLCLRPCDIFALCECFLWEPQIGPQVAEVPWGVPLARAIALATKHPDVAIRILLPQSGASPCSGDVVYKGYALSQVLAILV